MKGMFGIDMFCGNSGTHSGCAACTRVPSQGIAQGRSALGFILVAFQATKAANQALSGNSYFQVSANAHENTNGYEYGNAGQYVAQRATRIQPRAEQRDALGNASREMSAP